MLFGHVRAISPVDRLRWALKGYAEVTAVVRPTCSAHTAQQRLVQPVLAQMLALAAPRQRHLASSNGPPGMACIIRKTTMLTMNKTITMPISRPSMYRT